MYTEMDVLGDLVKRNLPKIATVRRVLLNFYKIWDCYASLNLAFESVNIWFCQLTYWQSLFSCLILVDSVESVDSSANLAVALRNWCRLRYLTTALNEYNLRKNLAELYMWNYALPIRICQHGVVSLNQRRNEEPLVKKDKWQDSILNTPKRCKAPVLNDGR